MAPRRHAGSRQTSLATSVTTQKTSRLDLSAQSVCKISVLRRSARNVAAKPNSGVREHTHNVRRRTGGLHLQNTSRRTKVYTGTGKPSLGLSDLLRTRPDSSSSESPSEPTASSSSSSSEEDVPIQCDDFPCCAAATGTVCDVPAQLTQCPRLYRHHTAANGVTHPAPIRTCTPCRRHGADNNCQAIDTVSNVHAQTGVRAQLCTTCIRDEVALYWARVQTNAQPAGTARVRRWPRRGITGTATVQNLCICRSTCVRDARDACHSCRTRMFRRHFIRPYRANEDALVHYNTSTLKGDNRRQGRGPARLKQSVINARQARGVKQSCPCGNEAEAVAATGTEWATVCQACMGVWIDPVRLPAGLGEADMSRRSRRWHKTKVRAVARGENYRVNIKRGWIETDEHIEAGR